MTFHQETRTTPSPKDGFFGEPPVHSDRIIYTPSPFAKENLTYLQETGDLKSLKIHTAKREHLASYLFFIVLSGYGSVRYGNTNYPVHTGDCVFLDCMQPYLHQSSPDLWSLKWVHFNGTNMDAIYHKYKERGGRVVFSPADRAAVVDTIQAIQTIAASDSYLRDMEIHEKLSCLLLLIMRESWHEKEWDTSAEKRYDIRTVREYLEQNFQEAIRLDDLADTFHISKYYLAHIFKKQYGVSITNFILQQRITTAKKYLRFTDWSIEKIAAECGYTDVNYFIRTFKKVEASTPGEYRKNW